MFRTLTTVTYDAAVPPASAQDPTLYPPADRSLLFRGKTYQQARADRDDLGAPKGILVCVLVSVILWIAIWLLLAAIV